MWTDADMCGAFLPCQPPPAIAQRVMGKVVDGGLDASVEKWEARRELQWAPQAPQSPRTNDAKVMVAVTLEGGETAAYRPPQSTHPAPVQADVEGGSRKHRRQCGDETTYDVPHRLSCRRTGRGGCRVGERSRQIRDGLPALTWAGGGSGERYP